MTSKKKWFMFMKNPEFIVPVCISLVAVYFSASLYKSNVRTLEVLRKELETNKGMLEINKGMLETNEETLDLLEREFLLTKRPFIGVIKTTLPKAIKDTDKMRFTLTIKNTGTLPGVISSYLIKSFTNDIEGSPDKKAKNVDIFVLQDQKYTFSSQIKNFNVEVIEQRKKLFYKLQINYRDYNDNGKQPRKYLYTLKEVYDVESNGWNVEYSKTETLTE